MKRQSTPILYIYGIVPNSLFYSQGRSLVREESVALFSHDVEPDLRQFAQTDSNETVISFAKITFIFVTCDKKTEKYQARASPGTFPYSSLKHLAK